MSDVNETLQQLLTRRLREMGKERGRDEPMSLNEVYEALPGPRPQWVSRELVRRVLVDGHTNIGSKAARTIATMFSLDEGEVLEAAGKRAPLGRFELPEEADRLEPGERRVVLDVIGAILAAGERATPAGESPATEDRYAGAEPAPPNVFGLAANAPRGEPEGVRSRRAQDEDAEQVDAPADD